MYNVCVWVCVCVCVCIHIYIGVFHVEAMYTPRGPRLIEFNARLGGGEVYETNLRATGVCLVVQAL